MKRDFLTQELGLSKEMTDKIMAQYGESVNSLKKENERLFAENEDLKTAVGGEEEHKTRIVELEGLNNELNERVTSLTGQLESTKIDNAVSVRLIGAGAKNLKAVGALIDMKKITMEDGVLTGLTEQIEALKSECDYMFYEEKSSGMRHTASANTEDGFTSFARAAAKLNQ